MFCWDFASAAAAASGVVTAWDVFRSVAGWRMALDLLALAACGGAFSVPLYAVIQHNAAQDERSRMIAANNVMNALFMVGGAGAVAGLAGAGFDAPSVLRMAAVANLGAGLWLVWGLRRLPAVGSLR